MKEFNEIVLAKEFLTPVKGKLSSTKGTWTINKGTRRSNTLLIKSCI